MYRVLLTPFVLTLLGPAVPPPNVTDTRDWAQWRGPNRDAVCTETGLLKTWPKEGPPLVWSARAVNGKDNVGKGYASIAIAGGKIYLGQFGFAGTPQVVWMPLKGGTLKPFLTGFNKVPVFGVGISHGWLYVGTGAGFVYRVHL